MSKTQSKLAVTISEATCCCWAGVWYYYSEEYPLGSMKLYYTDCSEGTSFWQKYDTSLPDPDWVTVLISDPGLSPDGSIYNPYAPGALGTGLYRVKISIPGCCDTYSSIIEAYLA